MDATAPKAPAAPPALPEGFQLDGYLRKADAESNIVRIVGRVLGEQDEALLIDTAEGIYALPSGSVRRLQYLDDGSLYVIDIDPTSTCVLHTTVKRLIRTRTGTFPSGSPDELLTSPYWSEPAGTAGTAAAVPTIDRP